MAKNRAFLKDEELKLRSSGTAATSTETGTGVRVGALGNILYGVMFVSSLAQSSPVTESYKLKFQESADNLSYSDIPGGETTISETGRSDVQFELTLSKPYVRHVLTLADTSSPAATSIDGEIYVTSVAGSEPSAV